MRDCRATSGLRLVLVKNYDNDINAWVNFRRAKRGLSGKGETKVVDLNNYCANQNEKGERLFSYFACHTVFKREYL